MTLILKHRQQFFYRKKGPKPFCYRLQVGGLGDIGDSSDWQLLQMIAESLFPDRLFTGYPVYQQPQPYSELLKHLDLFLENESAINKTDE
jgi:hypothetical protein